MKTTTLALALLFSGSIAQAKSFEVLNPEVKQGGVLIIKIAPQWQSTAVFNPAISVFERHYLPNKYGEIFVGVDVNTKPGKHIATLVEYSRGIKLSRDYEEIEVLIKNFPEVKILRNRGKIDVNRWKKDQLKVQQAYKKSNKYESRTEGSFIQPLDIIAITDEFNLQRKFLDGVSIHRGTDLKTAIGAPVYAINSGNVLLADYNFLLEGNLVILDHGSGIFSYYLHLSRVDVRDGQFVKKGDVIALSGDTGLGVRYPHLHFAVKIHGISIDPLEFIKTINKNLNR